MEDGLGGPRCVWVAVVGCAAGRYQVNGWAHAGWEVQLSGVGGWVHICPGTEPVYAQPYSPSIRRLGHIHPCNHPHPSAPSPTATATAGTVARGSLRVNDTLELPELKLEKKVRSMQVGPWTGVWECGKENRALGREGGG